jgi:hypothetical protein
MGLNPENATILVKLMDSLAVVSRRKRERLITPAPVPVAETPTATAA